VYLPLEIAVLRIPCEKGVSSSRFSSGAASLVSSFQCSLRVAGSYSLLFGSFEDLRTGRLMFLSSSQRRHHTGAES